MTLDQKSDCNKCDNKKLIDCLLKLNDAIHSRYLIWKENIFKRNKTLYFSSFVFRLIFSEFLTCYLWLSIIIPTRRFVDYH